MEHLQQYAVWALGGTVGSLALWAAWKVFMAKVPDAIVNSVMVKVEAALKGQYLDGNPIPDADDRALVCRVAAALVEWAEKKLPNDGLGEQKMKLVLDRLYRYARLIPIIGARLAAGLQAQEPRLVEFISAVVTKMNKRLEQDAPPPKP